MRIHCIVVFQWVGRAVDAEKMLRHHVVQAVPVKDNLYSELIEMHALWLFVSSGKFHSQSHVVHLDARIHTLELTVHWSGFD